MKSLIQINPTNFLNTQFSPSIFPSLQKTPKFLHLKKFHYLPQTPKFSSIPSFPLPNSSNYSGWDDLKLGGHDSVHSTESTQLHNFLVTLGINDKKYIYIFLFGVISALAVSRIRVSSVILFPASVTIFGIGYLIGFLKKMRNAQMRKRSKDENLRSLVEFFDGFDVKMNNLKSNVKKGIECNHVTVEDLEFYVEGIELIRAEAVPVGRIVEGFFVTEKEGDGVLVESPRRSKKRKEIGEIGFDVAEYVGGLFGEKRVESKANRVKDRNVKRDIVGNEMNKQIRGDGAPPLGGDSVMNVVGHGKENGNASFLEDRSRTQDWDRDELERLGYMVRKGILDSEDMDSMVMNTRAKRFDRSEEHSYWNNRMKYMDNRLVSLNTERRNEIETWMPNDSLLDSMDFRVRLKHTETEAVFEQQHKHKRAVQDFCSSDMEEQGKKATDISGGSGSRHMSMSSGSDSTEASDHSAQADEYVSSSNISEDVMFDRYLSEANGLLKQARECLRSKGNEGKAENFLYKSAKVLSKAIVMKPMSLLAVGQLGNTYLLHGELKFKISRKLRAQLRNRASPLEKQDKLTNLLEDQVIGKDKIANLLIDVCEECEDLLVEAGRKYRMALSIDGNDARALYNWGLALSFRAQLIADIGPEGASDADQVFLAAIDKFDAMMSKVNVYAPDALFRWGAALQQRSRLRPIRSKEKVKLLQQAKRLYEDALHMDSDNRQVKEALSSCMSELNSRLF